MAIFLTLNESSASSRVVPMWCVQSNGTSAATNESGATFNFSIGGVYYGSGGSLSAVSANMGLYTANFAASKLSVMGQGFVMYSSGTALPTMTPFMVVPFNSFDSTRLGLVALPNAAANAAGGLPQIGTDYGSSFTVGVSNIKAATYSGVSVEVSNIKPGTYSGVSFAIKDSGIAPTSYQAGNYSGVSVEVKTGGIQTNSVGSATYSGVTFGANPVGDKTGYSINAITAGTYSSVTIQGLSNPATVVTAGTVTDKTGYGLAAGTYSGATVGINNIAPATYSGVTVGINNIAAASYSGVTVDGAKFLSVAGERSAASSLLSTNIGNSRLVQEAIFAIRNRVAISGSTGTVFLPDDTTSAFTFSVTTDVVTITGVDPTG